MNCTEPHANLHAHLDAELSPGERRRVEAHLAECAACRADMAALRGLRARAASLCKDIPPARDLWGPIRAGLAEAGVASEARRTAARSGRSFWSWTVPLATAAAAALAVATAEPPPPRLPTWSVASLAGTPRIDARPVRREARFGVGQWLETDDRSRARIAVASLGEVTLEPNSRLRLAGAAATDHRLELARGRLRALIVAPPRIFYVDTPSATAVDLGCAYTLAVDEAGNGELQVTVGYVALEHGERESIIPSGAACLTRRGAGPGTPFRTDAPAELRTALERFDFAGGGDDALARILRLARPDDAVTLWHLLARTQGTARENVFDTLARNHGVPQGITRSGILAGDAAMRRAWGTALGLGSWLVSRQP